MKQQQVVPRQEIEPAPREKHGGDVSFAVGPQFGCVDIQFVGNDANSQSRVMCYMVHLSVMLQERVRRAALNNTGTNKVVADSRREEWTGTRSVETMYCHIYDRWVAGTH